MAMKVVHANPEGHRKPRSSNSDGQAYGLQLRHLTLVTTSLQLPRFPSTVLPQAFLRF